MADPAELLKAWQNAIRDVGSAAASVASAPPGLASDLLRSVENQGEMLEQVLQRQFDFERELLNRAVAPLHTTRELIDQVAGTLRAQAISFRAASTAFHQLAGLMDQQADLLDRAGATMRDPLSAFRSPAQKSPDDTKRPGKPSRSRSAGKPRRPRKGKP